MIHRSDGVVQPCLRPATANQLKPKNHAHPPLIACIFAISAFSWAQALPRSPLKSPASLVRRRKCESSSLSSADNSASYDSKLLLFSTSLSRASSYRGPSPIKLLSGCRRHCPAGVCSLWYSCAHYHVV